MPATIIWRCEEPGCGRSETVAARLDRDGQIESHDTWGPDGWSGVGDGVLRCPEHYDAYVARVMADRPDADWFGAATPAEQRP